jgi:hypothetical protein
MKKITFLLAMFACGMAQQAAWGQIKYHHSHPYFHQAGKDSVFIASYNEAQLPIYQQIEVAFSSENGKLVNMRFTKNFADTFEKSHMLMARAEKNLQRRNFVAARVELDSIYMIYSFYPYLYSTYFILAQKLNDESIITKYLKLFEKKEMFFHKNERSQSYYELYEFYRDAKKPKKALAFLQKSNAIITNKDKVRILKALEKKLK